jgi:hypothetical protein
MPGSTLKSRRPLETLKPGSDPSGLTQIFGFKENEKETI